jgi:uncharacterized protein (TIGR02147 family)
MNNEKPDIFSYSDFRHYLKDLYVFKKSENKGFSHRYIASKVRTTSSGWFSDVISGRINVTADYISRLATAFKLTAEETEQFRVLVNCNQTTDFEEKNRYLKLLIANTKTGATTVTMERFLYYTTWYIPVIREMLFFYDFVDNYKELAHKTCPHIKPSEAKRAIGILRELDFIAPDKNGFLKPNDAILRKESGFSPIHWVNFQKAALELSMNAIDFFNKEERDISAVLVALSEQSFAIAKEEIARLRKKLLELSEADKHRTTVYQCNIQIFPTTTPEKHVEQGGHNE